MISKNNIYFLVDTSDKFTQIIRLIQISVIIILNQKGFISFKDETLIHFTFF